jgi:hypothetical protein
VLTKFPLHDQRFIDVLARGTLQRNIGIVLRTLI